MTKVLKVSVEKVKNTGSVAYVPVTHAIRNGKNIKVGTELPSKYSVAVKIAKSNAKRLKCPLELCEEELA